MLLPQTMLMLGAVGLERKSAIGGGNAYRARYLAQLYLGPDHAAAHGSIS